MKQIGRIVDAIKEHSQHNQEQDAHRNKTSTQAWLMIACC